MSSEVVGSLGSRDLVRKECCFCIQAYEMNVSWMQMTTTCVDLPWTDDARSACDTGSDAGKAKDQLGDIRKRLDPLPEPAVSSGRGLGSSGMGSLAPPTPERPGPSPKLSAAGHSGADGAEPAGLLPIESLALAGAHACITPQPVVVVPPVAAPAPAAGFKAVPPAEGTAEGTAPAALDYAPLASDGPAKHDPAAADACTPQPAPSAGDSQHHSLTLESLDGLSLDEWPAILQRSSPQPHLGSSPRAGAHAEPRRPGHQRKRSWAAVALGGPVSPLTSGTAAEGLHACNGHADGVLAKEHGVLAEAEPRFVPSFLNVVL